MFCPRGRGPAAHGETSGRALEDCRRARRMRGRQQTDGRNVPARRGRTFPPYTVKTECEAGGTTHRTEKINGKKRRTSAGAEPLRQPQRNAAHAVRFARRSDLSGKAKSKNCPAARKGKKIRKAGGVTLPPFVSWRYIFSGDLWSFAFYTSILIRES